MARVKSGSRVKLETLVISEGVTTQAGKFSRLMQQAENAGTAIPNADEIAIKFTELSDLLTRAAGE